MARLSQRIKLALFLYSGGYSPGLFALRLASVIPKNVVETGELEIGECVVLEHDCVSNNYFDYWI